MWREEPSGILGGRGKEGRNKRRRKEKRKGNVQRANHHLGLDPIPFEWPLG
jgi:hypothetical protein